MSAIAIIKSIKNTLTKNELEIADFLLQAPQVIKTLSSKELAAAIGVSQSSIIKFSQKLGYKGYLEVKLAMVEAVNAKVVDTDWLGNISLKDNFEQLSQKLLASKNNVLSETSSLNNVRNIDEAVKAIMAANRILVSGIGASGLVATDLSYKLQKVGKAANAEPNGHIQIPYCSTFGKKDLLFCISESGNTSEVVEAATVAKKNGAVVISLSSFGSNKLNNVADIKLYTVAEKSSVRLSSILSRTSQEFVIDLLFIVLTQSSASSRKMVEKSNKAIKSFIEKR